MVLFNLVVHYKGKGYEIPDIDLDLYSLINMLTDACTAVFGEGGVGLEHDISSRASKPGGREKMKLNIDGDVCSLFGIYEKAGEGLVQIDMEVTLIQGNLVQKVVPIPPQPGSAPATGCYIP